MAQSANVPKFGNWESQEDVPYTAYFDKARKVRTSGGSRPKPEQEEPTKRSPETNNKRQGRSTYASGDENNSYERSPLHHQSRTPGRTVAAPSPLWDGTKNSYDGTARSKPRSNTKGNESPDKGAVVPKFGDWDKNDSSSADGYTHIFNKVREERNYVGAGTVSARTPSHPSIKPTSDSTKVTTFFNICETGKERRWRGRNDEKDRLKILWIREWL